MISGVSMNTAALAVRTRLSSFNREPILLLRAEFAPMWEWAG